MTMEIHLILDNIRSLHNVGSIFRTADAFGVAKIHLCGYTGKPTDRLGKAVAEVAKTALGAEQTVPWEYARNAWRVVEQLKKDGVTVLALENNIPGAVDLNAYSRNLLNSKTKDLDSRFRGNDKIVLILGNEVGGISAQLLKRADAIVSIPMRGKKESLNVSVACGIALYAFGGK